MSFHDLLSKDYRKSILPELIRIIAVFGNIAVFFYLSGWVMVADPQPAMPPTRWIERLQYGPKIIKFSDMSCDSIDTPLSSKSIASDSTTGIPDQKAYRYKENVPLAKSSFLDIIALGLAIFLTIKQFTFTRPEVDSFNEKIMLPAKEKSVAMMLLVFSCVKTCLQFFQDVPDYKTSGVYSSYPYGDQKNYRLLMNICLVISSAICVYSSRTFSFEMKMAEKRMTLRIVKLLTTVAFIIFITFLLIVTFLNDNQCIFLVYMFFIIFDLFRIVTMLFSNSKKDRVIDIRDFLVTLKWVSFGILISIIVVPWVYIHKKNFEFLTLEPKKGVYGWFNQLSSSVGLGNLDDGENPWPLFCKKNVFNILDYFTLLFQTEAEKGTQL